jgi:ABC-type glycerol-3-phosphate transport system permease component
MAVSTLSMIPVMVIFVAVECRFGHGIASTGLK